MKKLLFVLLFLIPSVVHAQTQTRTAIVVASCGSQSLTIGAVVYDTVDINGRSCSSAAGSITGTVTANAGTGWAASGLNIEATQQLVLTAISNISTGTVTIVVQGSKPNGNSPGSTGINVLPCLAANTPPTLTAASNYYLPCDDSGYLRVGMDSGFVASGAFASGALASGSIASGALASGSIASGAIASGAVASGAFAAGSLSAALPDPCMTNAVLTANINITAATTTKIIENSASNKNYICGISMFSETANSVAIVEDTDDSCASPSAGLYGGVTAATGIVMVANEGTNIGFAGHVVMKTSSTNMDVCLITSGTDQLSGTVAYVQVP